MPANTGTAIRRFSSPLLVLLVLASLFSLVATARVAARTTVAPEWRSRNLTALGHLGGQNYDLWVSGTTLFTANGSSVKAFDVSDPANPKALGAHYGFQRSFAACAASGTVLYARGVQGRGVRCRRSSQHGADGFAHDDVARLFGV